MQLLFHTALLVIAAVSAHFYGPYYEENRVDNEAHYVKHQDICKAFNITPDFYWLYGFSYHSNHTENKSCVYFHIENITESGMNWSSNFIRHEKREKINYTGIFYSTPYKNLSRDTQRTTHNSLYAHLRNGDWPMNYTLIYSDYANCSVFRVLQIHDGYGCMVLLSNTTAYTGMPNTCERQFNMTCATYHHKFEKVFNKSCTPPQILGET